MDKAGDFKHAIVIREDVKAFEQSKKEKRDEKEKRAKEHLGLLRQQIDEHQKMKHRPTEMAPQEFMINKNLIEEVEGYGPGLPKYKRPF